MLYVCLTAMHTYMDIGRQRMEEGGCFNVFCLLSISEVKLQCQSLVPMHTDLLMY